jgi:hypothetical protein
MLTFFTHFAFAFFLVARLSGVFWAWGLGSFFCVLLGFLLAVLLGSCVSFTWDGSVLLFGAGFSNTHTHSCELGSRGLSPEHTLPRSAWIVEALRVTSGEVLNPAWGDDVDGMVAVKLTTSAHFSILHSPRRRQLTTIAAAMVLDSATSDAAFDDGDGDNSYSTGSYPPHPPIPTFLGFQTGTFGDAGKQRFINLQLNLAQREFGFHPTPIEKEGISYYHALFYAAEAKGSLYGTLAGGAIGFLMTRRQRRVGFIFSSIGNKLRVAPKWQLIASRLTNFAFITAVGRLWGLTSYGVSAFNSVGKMQKEDPNMQRYLAARNQWLEQRQRSARAGIPPKPVLGTVEEVRKLGGRYEDNGEQQPLEDSQSLGGLEGYELIKPEDIGASRNAGDLVATRRASMETAAKARQAGDSQARERDEREKEDDPFFGGDEGGEQARPQAPPQGWRSSQSQPRGSAWDRLRREKLPGAESKDNDTKSSNWSLGNSNREPKEDSFSFSSGEDRARDREEAQRMFDERLQKERDGAGQDGFVNEGGQNRRR